MHVLGYFIDPETPPLGEFLARAARDRLRRVREMAIACAALGMPVDVERLARR